MIMQWNDLHPFYLIDEDDFFGANPNADPAYWAFASFWTPEEGVALSFGYDPRVVNSSFLHGQDHRFAMTFADRLNLATRAREMGYLADKNDPLAYITWTKRLGWAFSKKIEEIVLHRSVSKDLIAGGKTFLNPKIRQSLEKMVLGMAVAHLGYSPNQAQSRVPQEIADELLRVGISLDVDTVRKRLKDAAENHGHLLEQ